jgi:glycine hydroxymethyltransferase
MTTRGFGVAEAQKVAHLISDVLDAPGDDATTQRVIGEVSALCSKFPVYG